MNIQSRPSALAGIGEQEWKIRCDLAALYRLIAQLRMTDLIYTHISARLPGPEHHFLINPYGVLFHRITASSLVKIDLDGNIVEQDVAQSRSVNAAGFTIHSAVHMARPDLMCVVHTHTAAGIAVSAQKQGLLPISQQALKFYEHIGYHNYEGIAFDLSERERLVHDLGEHKAMILRNHGLLACGRTIPEAFHEIYYLERACQAQVATLAGGAELVFPPEQVRRHAAKQFQREEILEHCEMAWNAALTLIENEQPDYRL